MTLIERTTDRALGAAKAIVALATPIVTLFLTESLADLSSSSEVWVAALATMVAVYLTPNRQ